MVELDRRDRVHVLRLGAGENRFDRRFVADVDAALDEVEAARDTALVTTGAGKFYSYGLDLEWLLSGAEGTAGFLDSVHRLFARVLTFPAVTVAAVNGHAFGAGAQIALAHDFRVMRADRGYLCMPEVDLPAPLSPAMNALLAATVPIVTLREMLVTGRRYGGHDALAAQLVHAVASEAELEDLAVAAAAPHAGKDPDTVRALKRDLFAAALAVIDPSD